MLHVTDRPVTQNRICIGTNNSMFIDYLPFSQLHIFAEKQINNVNDLNEAFGGNAMS